MTVPAGHNHTPLDAAPDTLTFEGVRQQLETGDARFKDHAANLARMLMKGEITLEQFDAVAPEVTEQDEPLPSTSVPASKAEVVRLSTYKGRVSRDSFDPRQLAGNEHNDRRWD